MEQAGGKDEGLDLGEKIKPSLLNMQSLLWLTCHFQRTVCIFKLDGLKTKPCSPPAEVTDSWSCPSGMRNSDWVSSWLAVMADSRAGLTTSLVEKEGEAAPLAAAVDTVEATGIWQNFPVKVGGQRQRSDCRQTPPFLHSRGQRTAGNRQQQQHQTHWDSWTELDWFLAHTPSLTKCSTNERPFEKFWDLKKKKTKFILEDDPRLTGGKITTDVKLFFLYFTHQLSYISLYDIQYMTIKVVLLLLLISVVQHYTQ